MPRMSKKLKHEWSLFLNHRGRRCYLILERVSDNNDMCDISGTPPDA